MVPDTDLQIQIVLKALSDTIAPAVDPTNKMATEQLQLVIATLAMVRERAPVERRLVRRLIEDDMALAEQLAGLAGIGCAQALLGASAAARAALADPELGTVELADVRSNLTKVTAMAIASAGEGGVSQLGPIVVEGSRASLERLRAWCLPSGFEPDPSAIPVLETLL
jgi:hypothetical protein